jgi:uncharacterized protein YlxW (UPF0749 family)
MTASNATRRSLELSQTTRNARAAIQNLDASVEWLLNELASIREDLVASARRLARAE